MIHIRAGAGARTRGRARTHACVCVRVCVCACVLEGRPGSGARSCAACAGGRWLCWAAPAQRSPPDLQPCGGQRRQRHAISAPRTAGIGPVPRYARGGPGAAGWTMGPDHGPGAPRGPALRGCRTTVAECCGKHPIGPPTVKCSGIGTARAIEAGSGLVPGKIKLNTCGRAGCRSRVRNVEPL